MKKKILMYLPTHQRITEYYINNNRNRKMSSSNTYNFCLENSENKVQSKYPEIYKIICLKNIKENEYISPSDDDISDNESESDTTTISTEKSNDEESLVESIEYLESLESESDDNVSEYSI